MKMAPLRTIAALILGAGAATGFTPATPYVATRQVESITRQDTSLNVYGMNSDTFDKAMAEFEADYPGFSKWGWGPSVHAEKWNGRHAMFGWLFICATAYAKGHGLFPSADMMLKTKEWGTLAYISGFKNTEVTITNQRAIILIANVHCLLVGVTATVAPQPWFDPLLLDPNMEESYERAINTKPYGIIPDMSFKQWGLTETAEMMNGRMAMFGLIMLILTSMTQGKPMLDVVNEWLGGLYY